MDIETFGQRLKRIRLSRGLSQRRLATLAGLTNGAISQAESGLLWVGQLPSYDILKRLAKALNVAVEVLAGEVTEPIPARPTFLTEPIETLLSKLGAVAVGATERRIDQAVSAGKGNGIGETFGEYLPDEDLYLVEVEGDCMVPEINSGDRVKFDPELEPENGDWVVATLDGEKAIVKGYEVKGPVQRLLPLNGEPLVIDENVRIVGVVLFREVPGPRGRRKRQAKKAPRTSWDT